MQEESRWNVIRGLLWLKTRRARRWDIPLNATQNLTLAKNTATTGPMSSLTQLTWMMWCAQSAWFRVFSPSSNGSRQITWRRHFTDMPNTPPSTPKRTSRSIFGFISGPELTISKPSSKSYDQERFHVPHPSLQRPTSNECRNRFPLQRNNDGRRRNNRHLSRRRNLLLGPRPALHIPSPRWVTFPIFKPGWDNVESAHELRISQCCCWRRVKDISSSWSRASIEDCAEGRLWDWRGVGSWRGEFSTPEFQSFSHNQDIVYEMRLEMC